MEKSSEIQAKLALLNNPIWFRLFLRNLALNANEDIYLTDPDVNQGAESWEEVMKELLGLVQEEKVKEILKKMIELVPKVCTGLYGHVPAEQWHDFCQSSQEMLDSIRLLFEHYEVNLNEI